MIFFDEAINHQYRKQCLTILGSSLADMMALCLFPLYCINPTGIQFYTWKILVKHIVEDFSYMNTITRDEDDDNEFLQMLWTCGIETLYKLPLTILTMVVCMIVPTVWSAGWNGFAFYRQEKQKKYVAVPLTDIKQFYDIYEEEWELTINLLMHGVIDFWVSPFVLLAYISPLRHTPMSKLSTRIKAEHRPGDISYLKPRHWDYQYSTLYREKAVKYGSLAVAGNLVSLVSLFSSPFFQRKK